MPEYWSGYFCVAFYLVSKAFVALITARTTVINGEERFSAIAPVWMCKLLAAPDAVGEGWAVVVSLIPALVTSFYLFAVGVFEEVHYWNILIGLSFGMVGAFVFWYVLNAWYYLAYEQPSCDSNPDEVLTLGANAARTILFPRRCFFLNSPGTRMIDRDLTLEDMETPLRGSAFGKLSRRIADYLNRVVDLPGYVYDGDLVYEAHIFSFIAAIGFGLVFWTLYPLTAPVPTRWVTLSFLTLILILAGALWIFGCGKNTNATMRRWRTVLSVAAVVFCAAFPAIWYHTSPDRFPTLASVLLIVTLLGWALCAIAFFLDRFRIPVLTLFVLAAVLPRAFWHEVFYGGQEEHYLSTTPLSADPEVPTPAAFLSSRLKLASDANDTRPFIVITATGGGLHASAWTARILRELNATFDKLDQQSFRDHILLLSTVSGSSVSATYYLQELQQSNEKKNQPDLAKTVIASQCSSLEAVGWGLVYYDLTKAMVPLAGWVPPSSGDDDLEKSPLGKDRTWALRRSIERNANDGYCYWSAYDNGPREMEPPAFPKKSWLRRLWPDHGEESKPSTLATIRASDKIPAFTMNTTTAEGGDRFLLANYRLPKYSIGPVEGPPAESFLDLGLPKTKYADLPLATAAQLSATFPYVSSAARIPVGYTSNSVHFVDGGYYDDDGTSSAIEFLRYALDPPQFGSSEGGQQQDRNDQQEVLQRLKPHALRILLIEIRNSVDTDASGTATKALNPESSGPSGLLEQLTKPLEGFWNAGHGSVTGRDRNGLDLLILSHPNNLELHQIILDDKTLPKKWFGLKSAQDPLSWSLTPAERQEVKSSAEKMADCYGVAKNWFIRFDIYWKDSLDKGESPSRCLTTNGQ